MNLSEKMNEIINQFLLTTDKTISFETTCLLPGRAEFLYSACKPFAEHCKSIQQFKETVDSKFIYRNKLDKVCFSHVAIYAYLRQSSERQYL